MHRRLYRNRCLSCFHSLRFSPFFPNGESDGRQRSSRRTHRAGFSLGCPGVRLVLDGLDEQLVVEIRQVAGNLFEFHGPGWIVDQNASLMSNRNPTPAKVRT